MSNIKLSDTVLPTIVLDYLEWLTYVKRASPLTVKSYRKDLHVLIEGVTPSKILSVHETQIRRLVASAHAAGNSPPTLARRLSCWRSFYQWLIVNKKCDHNPVTNVKSPKRPKTLPNTLSIDQLLGMLEHQFPKRLHNNPLVIRDRAIFELFYSSGLRLSELVALNDTDVRDMLQGEVTVLGKRQKQRIVPVGDKAIAALQSWLNVRHTLNVPKPDQDTSPLFVNRLGKRLSIRSVQMRLAKWSQAAGIPVHVHPHMLRHSFASHVLQSSGDLRAVQEMLGHASIATTQIYTHLDFQSLARAYDKTHPRARLPLKVVKP